jgi:hypothetical protein
MAEQWYFAWGENRFGPFSADQLKALAALGRLQPTDTVWKEGVEKGVTADRVKHLFATSRVNALSVEANAPLAPEPASPPERPHNLCSPNPNGGTKLDPWVNAEYDDQTPQDQLQDIIPNGLVLEGIAGGNDSEAPAPASQFSSPEPKMMEGAEPEGAANQTSAPKKPAKKGRAMAMKGAVIISQNGETAQYRKKCVKCGHEDACRTTLPIRNIVTTTSFFCPKCRKAGEVVIRCVT